MQICYCGRGWGGASCRTFHLFQMDRGLHRPLLTFNLTQQKCTLIFLSIYKYDTHIYINTLYIYKNIYQLIYRGNSICLRNDGKKKTLCWKQINVLSSDINVTLCWSLGQVMWSKGFSNDGSGPNGASWGCSSETVLASQRLLFFIFMIYFTLMQHTVNT